MPRHFSLQEAEHQLPEVERALRDALIHKGEYEKAHQELESHTRRIRMLGGARVNPGPLIAVRSRRDTSAAALKEALERIEEVGAGWGRAWRGGVAARRRGAQPRRCDGAPE